MSLPGGSVGLNLFQQPGWFLLLPGSWSGRAGPSESAEFQGVLEATFLLFPSLLKKLPAGWSVLNLEERLLHKTPPLPPALTYFLPPSSPVIPKPWKE